METPICYMWEGKYLQPYWKTGFIKTDHRLKTFCTPDEFAQMPQGTYKNVHSNIFCKCKTLKQPNIHCRVGKKKKKDKSNTECYKSMTNEWTRASCNSMDKYYKKDVGKKIPSLFHIHKINNQ